jgi:hypothetical protein
VILAAIELVIESHMNQFQNGLAIKICQNFEALNVL